MRNSLICLFHILKICLGNQNMTHWQHSKTSKFFRCVENNWRESSWHFRVQTNFNSCLNLVLTFYKNVKKFFSMNNSFSIIGHETNQGCIPLICNFCKGCWTTCHENLSDSVFKSFDTFFIYSQISLCSDLFCVILKFPNAISVVNGLFIQSTLWKNSHIKSCHWE